MIMTKQSVRTMRPTHIFTYTTVRCGINQA